MYLLIREREDMLVEVRGKEEAEGGEQGDGAEH